ncbi:stage V sporulation protein S [Actinacidiphila sp. ITFR-21]|uniref:stage V sporulation protein S n=1 Tax=Actinacidiphila sp. ITFR-21 TaxID=3075199 RepID=UPI00288A814F|nr:stage V sporulation protein S [Streptomyces sp. ITFR-21]WNI17584.1 stage V sporulation protein S [Streptomyces sp. ITFR-21]WNI17724.1 stage V sporulation protein S [Streptomyces sp. ITFR-21]
MQTQSDAVSEKEFRVKSTTPAPELGSAIAHAINAGHVVVLKPVGAGAVNQSVKAIPIAQSFVSSFGTRLTEEISFFRSKSPQGDILGIAIRVMGS